MILKKVIIYLIKIYQKYISPMKTTTCPYYPDCIRLKVCANNMECTAANRKEHIIDMKRSMLYQYELYKYKKNK